MRRVSLNWFLNINYNRLTVRWIEFNCKRENSFGLCWERSYTFSNLILSKTGGQAVTLSVATSLSLFHQTQSVLKLHFNCFAHPMLLIKWAGTILRHLAELI